jgi:heme/copper-type cytochrome/quinol oxidase subunit 2
VITALLGMEVNSSDTDLRIATEAKVLSLLLSLLFVVVVIIVIIIIVVVVVVVFR